ncbi:MAG: tetratricopeptide repeat-containing protein [Chloroflexus sp.]
MGGKLPIDLEQWLSRGALAARRGDLIGARRIFRALARMAPDERRVWIGLARVAETAAEREAALRRAALIVTALPPVLNSPETETPVTLPPALPRTNEAPEMATQPPSAPVLPPVNAPARPKPNLRWRWSVILVAGTLLGLGFGWWIRPSAAPPSATLPPTLSAIGPLPSPLPIGLSVATSVIPSPSPPPPTPSPAPTASPEPDMRVLGQLISLDNWQIGLLRPDDVVLIDGELGTIRPTGRLLVALLAVSNEAATDRILPASFFALEDDVGQRYRPLSGASRQYLEQFGRGLYGDLALEDIFTPQSGLRSVPVLFDVPANRVPVRLWAGNEGWSLR